MFRPALRSAFSSLETPFYFYNMSLLHKTLDLYTSCLKKYGYHAHYALKANANDRILEAMKLAGLGADCVSGNEVVLALKSGFSPNKIVFAGVGKSDKEIQTALEGSIFCFNCESIPEIERINELAGGMGKVANISLRINPDIDAHTHKYISTGRAQDKFGISPWMFGEVWELLSRCLHVSLIGLHFHIGSQITDIQVFKTLCVRAHTLQKWFTDKGAHLQVVNLGGGLGVDYQDPLTHSIADFDSYFALIHQNLKPLSGQQVHFEPGRSLVAQSGFLISRVLYVKKGKGIKFAILDAGMNDLIRPALYGARHHIINLSSAGRMMRYDVVGPICESSDRFAKSVLLPEVKRGDFIAICSAGAYGQVMGLQYNLRDLAKTYYSDQLP
ncbi:MAG: diaminopimelate decarboxylase [Bacteroidetes bacterium]|nr:diaminopimelate decarboxylase [Bacteroidota bacterium]